MKGVHVKLAMVESLTHPRKNKNAKDTTSFTS